MKRVAGAPKLKKPLIDFEKSEAGFRNSAAEAWALVGRLAAGRTVLLSLENGPEREKAERLWKRLVAHLAKSLRVAFAHWTLLQAVISYEEALLLWEKEMPSQEAIEAIGGEELFSHWRDRSDPPEWLTPEEGRLLVQLSWPPAAVSADPIGAGLREAYAEIPF